MKGIEEMTKKEYAGRCIGMTFDFVRHVIEHPELIDTIPNGGELDFIDNDVPFKVEKGQRKRIVRYKVGHTFEPVNR